MRRPAVDAQLNETSGGQPVIAVIKASDVMIGID